MAALRREKEIMEHVPGSRAKSADPVDTGIIIGMELPPRTVLIPA